MDECCSSLHFAWINEGELGTQRKESLSISTPNPLRAWDSDWGPLSPPSRTSALKMSSLSKLLLLI